MNRLALVTAARVVQTGRGMWTSTNLLEAVARRADAPALITVDGDNVIPVAASALADRVHRLASGLLSAGVVRGQPIALYAPNGVDWVVARLAIAAAGAVAAAIDDQAEADEAAMVLRDSGSRLVFTAAAHVPALRALPEAAGAQIYVMGADGRADAPAEGWETLFAPQATPLPEIAGADEAMLVYTSGTTGAPKSFALTYDNLGANVSAICGLGAIGRGDRLVLPLPLHHVYPLVVGLLTPLAAGAAVVFPESATGPHVLRAIRAADATVLIGVPRLYEAMLAGLRGRVTARGRLAAMLFRVMLAAAVEFRRRFGVRIGRALFRRVHDQVGPRLRLMVSAGAKLEGNIVWQLEGLGWQVLTGYGLAETASAFTGNPPGRQRIGSEGLALAGGEVRIDAPDPDGRGEIQVRGPSVFAGYRNNPEANRAAFTADGWFRTGDQGSLDDDGYVYVTGRLKELIVLAGGKNVFPEELEAAYGADPAVRELAILERSGSLVGLVVPDLDAIRDSGSPRIEDVVRVALTTTAQRLPSHQRLSGFALTRAPLPRTRLGKYRRFELPALYDAAKAGRRPGTAAMPELDRAVIERSPGREVWALLQRRYPGLADDLDANPQLDLGIDSLEWLAVAMELEAVLGIRLSEADVNGVGSIRDLIASAERAGSAASSGGRAGAGLDPADADRRWLEPTPAWLVPFAAAAYGLNRTLMRALFRLRVHGAEHLPERDPYVIVANHVSDLDVLVVAAAVPYRRMRRVHWSGDRARLFGGPIRRRLARMLNIFPVDERAPAASLAMATAVLQQGDSLIWFPESWRSPTGRLQPFLPGIGRVLTAAPVPVVPALIIGTFEAMPRDRRLPKLHRVAIRFAAPMTLEQLEDGAHGATRELRIVACLHRELARLAGDE